MSEAKFTPGPWTFDGGYHSPPNLEVRSSNKTICVLENPKGGDLNEIIPNACLIAVAPDLYNALMAITIAAEMEGLPGMPGNVGRAWKIVIDRCNEVLSKAKGEKVINDLS